jgi:hypothetical protein
MSDNRDSNLSSAFDALLDKNWQRLDALTGATPRVTPPPRPTAASAAPTAPGSGKRRSGQSDGREFSFDI